MVALLMPDAPQADVPHMPEYEKVIRPITIGEFLRIVPGGFLALAGLMGMVGGLLEWQDTASGAGRMLNLPIVAATDLHDGQKARVQAVVVAPHGAERSPIGKESVAWWQTVTWREWHDSFDSTTSDEPSRMPYRLKKRDAQSSSTLRLESDGVELTARPGAVPPHAPWGSKEQRISSVAGLRHATKRSKAWETDQYGRSVGGERVTYEFAVDANDRVLVAGVARRSQRGWSMKPIGRVPVVSAGSATQVEAAIVRDLRMAKLLAGGAFVVFLLFGGSAALAIRSIRRRKAQRLGFDLDSSRQMTNAEWLGDANPQQNAAVHPVTDADGNLVDGDGNVIEDERAA